LEQNKKTIQRFYLFILALSFFLLFINKRFFPGSISADQIGIFIMAFLFLPTAFDSCLK